MLRLMCNHVAKYFGLDNLSFVDAIVMILVSSTVLVSLYGMLVLIMILGETQ